jgi:steroid delta-isomerase-like uncharacterized protein
MRREEAMSTEENKALVRRALDETINRRDLAAVGVYYAHDHVAHMPGLPEPVRGVEGERQLTAAFHGGFPDGRITIEDLVAEGDRVAARLIFHGTQQGEFNGIPPTGKAVSMPGMALFRIAAGKISESWHLPDTLGMLQQLGMMPAPG